MTSTARTSISAFPRGHEFPASRFSLSAGEVAAYLRAIGDTANYGSHAPPLAAVALGLNALQQHIALPQGSLHTGQEVEHHAALRCGDELTLSGRIAQRSERQGFVISVIEFEIAAGGEVAVRARTTIMAPAGGA
ncbi:MAG: MaoC family dehydratase N-terminal domain-containing protein [Chloroflexi bacterium]|nr:MaoC family dehydratase N-terminal domain-containing protein [Chloroflexota bacterium]